LIGTNAAAEREAVTEVPEEVAPAAAEAVPEELHRDEPQAESNEPEIWPEVEAEPEKKAEPQMPVITAKIRPLIAHKVVDRLSDSIIREVALEAVPRIAEKLIREALSDTGRSNENKEAKETSA